MFARQEELLRSLGLARSKETEKSAEE